MLAIITKMTLTQVSTWFANARRRLKKENKMTWEPKNKTDDDEDAIISDEEKDDIDLDKCHNPKGNKHKQFQPKCKNTILLFSTASKVGVNGPDRKWREHEKKNWCCKNCFDKIVLPLKMFNVCLKLSWEHYLCVCPDV